MFQLHKSNRLRIYVETLQGEFFGRCLRQLVDLLPPKRVQGAGEEASEPKPDKDDQYKVRSSFLFSSLLFSSLLPFCFRWRLEERLEQLLLFEKKKKEKKYQYVKFQIVME